MAPTEIIPTPWDGHKITKPGLYSNIPLVQYHGDITDGPSASSTTLRKIFNESAAEYWDESYLNPKREDKEDSEKKAFVMGRAVHHLILGESGFAQAFVERPETYRNEKGEVKPWSGNANVCKKWLRDTQATGRSVLKTDEIEDIRGMAISIGKNPLVKQGVLNGLVEQSLFWKDKKTGIWLKARPDVIPTSSGEVTDLKTTTSVQRDDLVRTIGDLGYHQQAALIGEGLFVVLGIQMTTFTLLFVKKTRPYSCREVFLKDGAIVDGAACNTFALGVMADCLKTGNWPGPGEETGGEFMDISDYRRKQIELRLAGMSL